jgi:hypothetical protein
MSVEKWQKIARFDMNEKQYWPKILAVALDIDEIQLRDAPEETLELGVSFIRYALEYGEHEKAQVKPLDDMTFGDFIDLDIFMYDGAVKSLHQIIEKFTDKDRTLEMPAALKALQQISNWRKQVYRNFEGLLSDGEVYDNEIEEEQEESQAPDPRRIWYSVLVNLAQEDILKMETITQQPFRNALNFMSWRKEDNQRRQRELDKIKQNTRR